MNQHLKKMAGCPRVVNLKKSHPKSVAFTGPFLAVRNEISGAPYERLFCSFVRPRNLHCEIQNLHPAKTVIQIFPQAFTLVSLLLMSVKANIITSWTLQQIKMNNLNFRRLMTLIRGDYCNKIKTKHGQNCTSEDLQRL